MAWLLLHLSTFPYTRTDFNTQPFTVYRSMYSNVFCSKPFLFGVIDRTLLYRLSSIMVQIFDCYFSILQGFYFWIFSLHRPLSPFANLHILNFNLGLIWISWPRMLRHTLKTIGASYFTIIIIIVWSASTFRQRPLLWSLLTYSVCLYQPSFGCRTSLNYILLTLKF